MRSNVALFDPQLYERAWGLEADNAEMRRTYPQTRTFFNVLLGLGRGYGKVASIADLSCGSGDLARALAKDSGIEPVLGDLGEGHEIRGPLSETILNIGTVDLFVCTETIEHLKDPDGDLALIAEHARALLLSTPVDEAEPANGHLWTWSREDVEAMLETAGFITRVFVRLDMTREWYDHCEFGMWLCERRRA